MRRRGSCAEEKLCGRGHACEHERVPLFDTKFGADFLAGVPTEPGGREKKERKRRALVNAAARIEWDVCDSALAAALRA